MISDSLASAIPRSLALAGHGADLRRGCHPGAGSHAYKLAENAPNEEVSELLVSE